jgi:hypothetical protein
MSGQTYLYLELKDKIEKDNPDISTWKLRDKLREEYPKLTIEEVVFQYRARTIFDKTITEFTNFAQKHLNLQLPYESQSKANKFSISPATLYALVQFYPVVGKHWDRRCFNLQQEILFKQMLLEEKDRRLHQAWDNACAERLKYQEREKLATTTIKNLERDVNNLNTQLINERKKYLEFEKQEASSIIDTQQEIKKLKDREKHFVELAQTIKSISSSDLSDFVEQYNVALRKIEDLSGINTTFEKKIQQLEKIIENLNNSALDNNRNFHQQNICFEDFQQKFITFDELVHSIENSLLLVNSQCRDYARTNTNLSREETSMKSSDGRHSFESDTSALAQEITVLEAKIDDLQKQIDILHEKDASQHHVYEEIIRQEHEKLREAEENSKVVQAELHEAQLKFAEVLAALKDISVKHDRCKVQYTSLHEYAKQQVKQNESQAQIIVEIISFIQQLNGQILQLDPLKNLLGLLTPTSVQNSTGQPTNNTGNTRRTHGNRPNSPSQGRPKSLNSVQPRATSTSPSSGTRKTSNDQSISTPISNVQEFTTPPTQVKNSQVLSVGKKECNSGDEIAKTLIFFNISVTGTPLLDESEKKEDFISSNDKSIVSPTNSSVDIKAGDSTLSTTSVDALISNSCENMDHTLQPYDEEKEGTPISLEERDDVSSSVISGTITENREQITSFQNSAAVTSCECTKSVDVITSVEEEDSVEESSYDSCDNMDTVQSSEDENEVAPSSFGERNVALSLDISGTMIAKEEQTATFRNESVISSVEEESKEHKIAAPVTTTSEVQAFTVAAMNTTAISVQSTQEVPDMSDATPPEGIGVAVTAKKTYWYDFLFRPQYNFS